MAAIVLAMLFILVLAVGIGAVVLIGIEGRWRERAPKLAHKLARAAQHLNGDGKPPRRLIRLLG